MVDVWAMSLFANSSGAEVEGSKAARAARAHAWGGECGVTQPSLTFPTWSPTKRIDMMCGAAAAGGGCWLHTSDTGAGTRCCMRAGRALWLQTRGLMGAAL